jgi:hypothetical protein
MKQAVIVHTNADVDPAGHEFPDALVALKEGFLNITTDDGDLVALFAPGTWGWFEIVTVVRRAGQ